MRRIVLTSSPSTDEGTFGDFVIDDKLTFKCGELPWKENQNGISCIPATGETPYVGKWFNSPKHGWCYRIYGVPNRDFIEIHSANFMGDSSKGKISQLLGCIALGKSIGKLETFPNSGVFQTAILRSKDAIAQFEGNMMEEDFELHVNRDF